MSNAPPASAARQELTLARVYNGYRLALALILLAAHLFVPEQQRLIGAQHQELFLLSCGAYLGLALFTAIILARRQDPPEPSRSFVSICVDLLALLLIMHASGGVASGLGLLLIICVAAAAVQLPGQLALLVAALASIGLLAQSAYLITSASQDSRSLLPAGLLGALYFATALFIRTLAGRIRTSQQLAQARAEDVSRLLHLNQQIVQRMRTGVLVVDDHHQVLMLNESAREMLDAGDQPLPPLPAPLARELLHWQRDRLYQSPPVRATAAGPELLARFTSLSDQDGDTLIFMEDQAQLTQHAQQLKLAALGRLTASIAHEIRNPLGAISHAAQLLLEEAELAAGDRRLAQIVQNHSQRMNGIIENVLQLSRRSAPNPQRLHLDTWLMGFRDDFLQSHPEARIDYAGAADCEVNADPNQLDQVLTNLLENALRHSAQSGGPPAARIELRRVGEAELWALDVIDFGPGVTPEDAEKIFEPFYTTVSQGSGLGLHLARELCEINQARLDYLRTPAGESCFRISFAHPDRRPLAAEALQEQR